MLFDVFGLKKIVFALAIKKHDVGPGLDRNCETHTVMVTAITNICDNLKMFRDHFMQKFMVQWLYGY